jgi:hypothetical protein
MDRAGDGAGDDDLAAHASLPPAQRAKNTVDTKDTKDTKLKRAFLLFLVSLVLLVVDILFERLRR